MNTTTEETITEDNWNLTTVGKEVRELSKMLYTAASQRSSLDEVDYLVSEIYKKMQYINDNCE